MKMSPGALGRFLGVNNIKITDITTDGDSNLAYYRDNKMNLSDAIDFENQTPEEVVNQIIDGRIL